LGQFRLLMYDVDGRMIYHLILAETEVTKDAERALLQPKIYIYTLC
jgi:hypothetical protein